VPGLSGLRFVCAGEAEKYPVKTRTLKRTAQPLWLLWAQTSAASVYLQKRPTPGVWAGLYCFPLFDHPHALAQAVPEWYRKDLHDAPPLKHVLTHKDLHLHPVRIQLPAAALANLDGEWMASSQWPTLGLPAPVRKLLLQV
jgi:A/G-specific adenine glycosylase